MKATEQDIVGEGDTVFVWYVVEATQTGNILGIPPPGRRVRWDAPDKYQVSNGKIAEEWAGDDVVAVLADLGSTHYHGVLDGEHATRWSTSVDRDPRQLDVIFSCR